MGDPCGWAEILEDYYGSEIGDFLPSSFEVSGEEGVFEIEASSFGARGPITCTIVDDAFTCEQQEVVPLAYDIGEYGWEYAIDYSGTVEDESTLRGIAVVSYPSIDGTTEYWLDRAGIRASDCTQSLELDLRFEG